ncbi:MAG: hypothetical protein ACYCZB_13850 [Acidiphilium sp.]
MSNDLVTIFEKMKAERERHLDRLNKWKAAGGTLENYPEHETIDDFIARERSAIENLSVAISRIKQPASSEQDSSSS